jgi:hypothetical protein
VRTPKDSCGVLKPHPPRWETEFGYILASLPDRKIHVRTTERLADELADLYLEYDILVKVVKQQ